MSHELERAVSTWRLRLPDTARTGRVGGVLGQSSGGSTELQDFREYAPGDDVRQLDWNAAARTDRLIVRVRREEVSPRVELIVDVSKSMSVSPRKEERARTLARLVHRLAMKDNLAPSLVLASDPPRREQADAPHLLRELTFDGVLPMPDALRRGNVVRPSGLRFVVSDFLFDTSMRAFLGRLARDTSSLVLLQVLDPEDESPSVATGVTGLVDSETGARLDRHVDEATVAHYRGRFEAHQTALRETARAVRAEHFTLSADGSLADVLRPLADRVLEAA